MKATYRVLAGLVCLLVLVQSASVAFGTFGILSFVDGGDDYTKAVAEDRASAAGGVGQNIHSFGAMAIAVVAILLLVVSFFAKIEGGVKWAGIVFLTVLLQWVFAFVAFRCPGRRPAARPERLRGLRDGDDGHAERQAFGGGRVEPGDDAGLTGPARNIRAAPAFHPIVES